jgi:hypothetical protein
VQLEEGSSVEQDLGLIQCLITAQDIGLWSGNRRKMEISEGSLLIPVTVTMHSVFLSADAISDMVLDDAISKEAAQVILSSSGSGSF